MISSANDSSGRPTSAGAMLGVRIVRLSYVVWIGLVVFANMLGSKLGRWLDPLQQVLACACFLGFLIYYGRYPKVTGGSKQDNWGLLGSLLRYLRDHPSQAVILLLLYLFIEGHVGAGLGIANLFWPDDPIGRVLSALTATMLLALLGVNAYYLIPEKREAASMQRLEEFVGLHTFKWPLRWFELDAAKPGEVQAHHISYLLRAARLPFLTLLALPVLLPHAFPNAAQSAPIYEWGTGVKLHWFDENRWKINTLTDIRSWFWAVGLFAVGAFGGIFLVKFLNWLSPKLAIVRDSVPFGIALGLGLIATSNVLGPLRPYTRLAPLGVPLAWLLMRRFSKQEEPANRRSGPIPRGLPEHLKVRPDKFASFLRFCSTVFVVYWFLSATLYDPLPLGSTHIYPGASPAVAICAALGLVAIGCLVFALLVPLQWRLVAIAALVVGLAAIGGDNRLRFPRMKYGDGDKHRLAEDIGKYYHDQSNPNVNQFNSTVAGLIDNHRTLDNWSRYVSGQAGEEGTSRPAAKPKLAVVCVTGGASRSAYWSALVLDRIENRLHDFHKHVRVITGASGGMVGAAYYVRWINDGCKGIAQTAGEFKPREWVSTIPLNGIDQVARHIALRSIWTTLTNLFPYVEPNDRGRVLEGTWRGLTDLSFHDLRTRERLGEIPSLIFSPVTVEDGRRLLISNLDLSLGKPDRVLALNQGSLIDWRDVEQPEERRFSLSAIEYFKFFPESPDLLLSTAARMSASFPFVSPAVNLPGRPKLRVVDAGYYDNYGVSVAVSWIYHNRCWLRENTSGVVLVQIRDSLSFDERFDYPSDDLQETIQGRVWAGLQFFHSPIDAVFQSRETSTTFRNDQEVALLESLFRQETKEAGFFTTVIFENAADATPGDEEPGWPGEKLFKSDSTGSLAEADDLQQHLASRGVTLNWNLTAAERRGLDASFPTDVADWAGDKHRGCRIERLQALSDIVHRVGEQYKEHSKDRPYALREYARARNYERLENLKRWWSPPR